MNKKKSEQLGMAFGTASNRLRKMILFHLIQQLKLDLCYRCGEIIISTDDLSIEHKIPWSNSKNPIELFFDLDNIAFSHLKCNTKSPKSMCPHGHLYTKENTYTSKGYRECILCRDGRRRQFREDNRIQDTSAYRKAMGWRN